VRTTPEEEYLAGAIKGTMTDMPAYVYANISASADASATPLIRAMVSTWT
jgi:hypothetical protein